MATFFCPHCDEEFELPGDRDVRCPSCLRRHDLVPVGEQARARTGSPKKHRMTTWALVALAILSVTAAALFWGFGARRDAGSSQGDSPGPVAPPRSEEVRALARAYPGEAGLGKLLSVLHQRIEAGGLSLTPDSPHLRPELLAPLLERDAPLQTSETALVSLLHLVAQAQGLTIEIREARKPKRGRTGFAGKRFALRVQGQIIPLSPRAPGEEQGATGAPGASFGEPLAANLLLAYADADRARSSRIAGDTRSAGAALEKALERAPRDPLVLFERCRLRMAQEMPDFALPDCERALFEGGDVDGLTTLAGFYIDSGLLAKALRAVNDAAALAPEAASVWVRRAEVRMAQIAEVDSSQHATLLSDIDEAITKAKERDTRVPGLHLVMAKRAFLTNDFVTGADEAELELRLHPRSEAAYTLLGDFYMRSSMWAELAKLYEGYRREWPAKPQGLQMLALAKMSQGSLTEAETLLRELLRVDPKRKGTRVQLATLLMNAERSGDALKLLEEERNRFPDEVTAYILQAQILVLSDRWAEARPLLEQTVSSWPKSPDALTLLYATLLQLGDTKGAADMIERASKALVKARYIVATRLVEEGMINEGIALLEEAWRRAPEDEEIATTLAAVLHALKRDDEVVRVQKEALARSPNPGRLEQRFKEQLETVSQTPAAP